MYDGERFDCWRMLLAVDDPDEALDFHYQRKVFLARYGKQSMLQWDDVPFTEINRYMNALLKMLKSESADSKLVEDS